MFFNIFSADNYNDTFLAAYPDYSHRITRTHKQHFHRKDAKDAEKIFYENNLILCALCGFAVS